MFGSPHDCKLAGMAPPWRLMNVHLQYITHASGGLSSASPEKPIAVLPRPVRRSSGSAVFCKPIRHLLLGPGLSRASTRPITHQIDCYDDESLPDIEQVLKDHFERRTRGRGNAGSRNNRVEPSRSIWQCWYELHD
jgi:hypothetical protein